MPQMFEDVFAKWDVHGSGSLSAGELWHMIKGNRLAADPFGVCPPTDACCADDGTKRAQWGAAIFEFGTTWLLVQKDGRVSKEDLRQTYDVSDLPFVVPERRLTAYQGTIFWRIKEAREKGKRWNKGFGFRDLVQLGQREFKARVA